MEQNRESKKDDELTHYLNRGMELFESGGYGNAWINIYATMAEHPVTHFWEVVIKRDGYEDETLRVQISDMTKYGPSDTDRVNLDRWLQELLAIYDLDELAS